MRCSITWVTVFSSVCADAPGYVALIVIAGGAIAGYCDTGSVVTESAPASMMMIAITHAKIGRSMKNRAIYRSPGAADPAAAGSAGAAGFGGVAVDDGSLGAALLPAPFAAAPVDIAVAGLVLAGTAL